MNDDWWATPAGVQAVLREEIKIRNDRIEELEAKLTQAEDFVLRTLRYAGNNGDDFLADKACAALAELKGETDETKR
jgi:hypothetical protein